MARPPTAMVKNDVTPRTMSVISISEPPFSEEIVKNQLVCGEIITHKTVTQLQLKELILDNFPMPAKLFIISYNTTATPSFRRDSPNTMQ